MRAVTDLNLTVARLLEAAGVRDEPRTVSAIDTNGLINVHFIVDMLDGDRFVVRLYGWPWGPIEPFDRMAKEAWLLPRLAAAGVPAPRVLAANRTESEAALLLSFIDGVGLGRIPNRTDEMWAATGAALRMVHDADIGMAGQPVGMLLDGRVDAFEGGWGQWHIDHTRGHAMRLAAARPEVNIDVHRCFPVADGKAAPLLGGPGRPVPPVTEPGWGGGSGAGQHGSDATWKTALRPPGL